MKIPVLLPNIFNHPFTYETDKKAEVGKYVLVPFEKINAIDNKKSNIFFYYLLKPFLKKIYVPGAKLNTPLDKLFNKLCDIYIRSIPCIENKKLKDDLFIFLTKLFA